MMIVDLLFGFLLVLAGRNLFWLCVGIVGFLIGVQCAASLGFSNEWVSLFLAIALGCLGAVLTVFFEWFMVVFGVGFLGGGYLLMNIFPSAAGQETYAWLIFVVGGIVGTCLMVIIFDWTLIIISSLLGSTLIVDAMHGTREFHEFLFIVIVTTGVMVQYLTLKGTVDQSHTAKHA